MSKYSRHLNFVQTRKMSCCFRDERYSKGPRNKTKAIVVKLFKVKGRADRLAALPALHIKFVPPNELMDRERDLKPCKIVQIQASFVLLWSPLMVPF